MAKKQNRKQQAKKVVRTPAPAVAASVASAPAATAPASVPQQRPAVSAPAASKARPVQAWCDFQDRYRHVNGELKQIGMIASSFLVVLLVLAFILR
jgi:hypothetical protein